MKAFIFSLIFFTHWSYAQEQTIQKFEDIPEAVFMNLNQCTNISTDLWTGQHQVMESENTAVYCTVSAEVLKCSFMDTKQKIFNTELFTGLITGKRMVIANDFTTFVGDLDSRFTHSVTSTSLNEGRIQIVKSCSGVWEYESILRKQAQEEEAKNKI